MSGPSGDPTAPAAGPATDDAPLSFAQQRLWFLEQFDPGDPVFHLRTALSLRGDLDVASMQSALDDLVVAQTKGFVSTVHF